MVTQVETDLGTAGTLKRLTRGLKAAGVLKLKKFFLNVYLFLRETETECEWVRGRERETQNLKQAPGSGLSAQSPTQGPNSRTARS